MARQLINCNGIYGVFLFVLPRLGWEDNIKVDIQETVLKGRGLHWSDSGYGLMTGCYEESNEPSDSIKRGEFLDYL
jgi:hypothetical protein